MPVIGLSAKSGEIDLREFGAKFDGVTDCLGAWNAAKVKLAGVTGARLVLAPGDLYSSDTLLLDITLRVSGHGTRPGGTFIHVKGGRHAMQLVSESGPVGGGAIASVLEDFLLTPATSPVAYSAGLVCVSGTTFILPTTYNTFVALCTISGTTSGAEPSWPGTEGGTVTSGGATFKMVAVGGLRSSASFVAMRLKSTGFPGDGFAVIADSGLGQQANKFRFEDCEGSGNVGRGFYQHGPDANAGMLLSCSASTNGKEGFLDDSDSGNYHFGCLVVANNGPSFPAVGFRNASARTGSFALYIGCYMDGDQTAEVNNGATWISGQGTALTGSGQVFGSARASHVTYSNTDGVNTAIWKLGAPNLPSLEEFSVSQDNIAHRNIFTYGNVSGRAIAGWVGWLINAATTPWAMSLANADVGAGHMWLTQDIFRGPDETGGNRFREGTTNSGPPSGTFSRNGDRLLERVPWVSGAAEFLCVQDVAGAATSASWAAVRANRVKSLAASATADTTDWYIGVTSTAADRTITLPTGAWDGMEVYVKDESGNCGAPHTITLAASGGETFDGASTVVTSTALGFVHVIRSGGQWHVLERSLLNDGTSSVSIDGSHNIKLVTAATELDLNNDGSAILKAGPSGSVTVLQISTAGALSLSNGFTRGTGPLIEGLVNHTVSAGLTSSDSGVTHTNGGASGTVVITLPAGVVGEPFDFHVRAAQTLEILAPASTTIRVGTKISSAAGNITSNTPGSHLRLRAYSATEYEAEAVVGVWNDPV
jgi:hypothetical protein